MLLTRLNPNREFGYMKRGFNNLDKFFKDDEFETGISSFIPVVNNRETDEAYYVEIDLPGIKKEDISIDVKDNVLSISGERKVKEEVKEEDYYKMESRYGKFLRSFTLPKNIDAEKINAKCENGVLEVVIPKYEELKETKKIEIQ